MGHLFCVYENIWPGAEKVTFDQKINFAESLLILQILIFRWYYVFGCANACTGHNFVTNTPIKLIFAIDIEVPDYKNPMPLGGHFVLKCSKACMASVTVS